MGSARNVGCDVAQVRGWDGACVSLEPYPGCALWAPEKVLTKLWGGYFPVSFYMYVRWLSVAELYWRCVAQLN